MTTPKGITLKHADGGKVTVADEGAAEIYRSQGWSEDGKAATSGPADSDKLTSTNRT